MSRLRVYSTEAIVLRRNDFGEADRMVTLMTPQLGKLKVLAKGARKITSRKAGHIELFTRTQLQLARGRNFDIITQAELVETYRVLREDMQRGSSAHYLCELVDQFGQEGSEDEALYQLLSDGLQWLCDAPDPKLAVRLFEMQLLTLTGYQPQLFECAITGAPLESDLAQSSAQVILTAFAPQQGGTLCAVAARQVREAVMLTPSALKLLRDLQTQTQADVLAMPISPELHGQVDRAMQRYMNYVLERAPKSALLLKQLSGS